MDEAALPFRQHNLLRAVVQGDAGMIANLAKDGVGVDFDIMPFSSPASRGMVSGGTPLHVACHQGRGRIAQVLLNNGADPNARENDGKTPLHIACQKGDRELAFLLLSKGADPNAQMHGGETPFFVACKSGHDDLVRLLLSHEARVNGVSSKFLPLVAAAQDGHHGIVAALLKAGANLSVPEADRGAFFHACKAGHQSTAVLLLEHDAPFGPAGDFYALHQAAHRGYDDISRALLARGADVSLIVRGNTPLHHACRKGHVVIAALLLDKGADPELKTGEESGAMMTPLELACRHGQEEITRLLLCVQRLDRSTLAARCDELRTLATQHGKQEVISLVERLPDGLLDVARWTLRFSCTHGAAHVASMVVRSLRATGHSEEEVLELLDAPGESGATFLHVAAANGHVECVRFLLSLGADCDVKDSRGFTPYTVAKSGRHDACAAALLVELERITSGKREEFLRGLALEDDAEKRKKRKKNKKKKKDAEPDSPHEKPDLPRSQSSLPDVNQVAVRDDGSSNAHSPPPTPEKPGPSSRENGVHLDADGDGNGLHVEADADGASVHSDGPKDQPKEETPEDRLHKARRRLQKKLRQIDDAFAKQAKQSVQPTAEQVDKRDKILAELRAVDDQLRGTQFANGGSPPPSQFVPPHAFPPYGYPFPHPDAAAEFYRMRPPPPGFPPPMMPMMPMYANGNGSFWPPWARAAPPPAWPHAMDYPPMPPPPMHLDMPPRPHDGEPVRAPAGSGEAQNGRAHADGPAAPMKFSFGDDEEDDPREESPGEARASEHSPLSGLPPAAAPPGVAADERPPSRGTATLAARENDSVHGAGNHGPRHSGVNGGSEHRPESLERAGRTSSNGNVSRNGGETSPELAPAAEAARTHLPAASPSPDVRTPPLPPHLHSPPQFDNPNTRSHPMLVPAPFPMPPPPMTGLPPYPPPFTILPPGMFVPVPVMLPPMVFAGPVPAPPVMCGQCFKMPAATRCLNCAKNFCTVCHDAQHKDVNPKHCKGSVLREQACPHCGESAAVWCGYCRLFLCQGESDRLHAEDGKTSHVLIDISA